MGISSLVELLVRKNPRVANNPQAQEFLRVIQNNDAQRGMEIAQNLCSEHGCDIETATQKARQFFRI